MPLIYPQMPEETARDKTDKMKSMDPFLCSKYASGNIKGMFWQPLGIRVTEKQIREISEKVEILADEFYYNPKHSIRRERQKNFDRELMIWLCGNLDILPSEAGRAGVWHFFNINLFPHIVSWRWGDEKDGEFKINPERFLSRRRNYFGTLWWRGWMFRDEGNSDPYHLYRGLDEDDYVSLMERTSIFGYKPLMLSIAEAIINIKQRNDITKDNIRLIIRKAVIMLRIHASIHNLWIYNRDELNSVVAEIFLQAESACNK